VKTQPTCPHGEAVFDVQGEKWVSTDGGPTAYMLTVTATCEACGEAFLFIDLPVNDDEHVGAASVSTDGTRLRVPMAPREQCFVDHHTVN
jgi:hypothetical protein